MKKFIFTILVFIMRYRIAIVIFKIVHFIFFTPFLIFFSILWFYSVISNWTYIRNNYTIRHLNELKNIGSQYLQTITPYAIHINIITWLIIIFLSNL